MYFFDDTEKNQEDIEQNLKLKNLGILPIDKKDEILIVQDNNFNAITISLKEGE